VPPEEAAAVLEKAKPQRELRGGTGPAGPLFTLPDAESPKEE
jgi:hypothetical protein